MEQKNDNLIKLQVYITKEMLGKIDRLAEKNFRTRSGQVSFMINNFKIENSGGGTHDEQKTV